MNSGTIANEMEQLRKKARMVDGAMKLYLALVVLGMTVTWLCGSLGVSPAVITMIPFIIMGSIVILVVIIIVGNKYKSEYRGRYKKDFVRSLIGELVSELSYAPDMGFTTKDVDNFGLVRLGNRFYSEDYMKASYNDVTFELSDVKVQYHSSNGKNSHTTTYFKGRMLTFPFHKKNLSAVQIFSKGFDYRKSIKEYGKMHKIELEDSEFNQMFDVNASDEVDAFYVLTPPLIQRLKEANRLCKTVAFSVINGKITIGLDDGKNSFEPNYQRPLDYDKERIRVENDLKVVFDFIDILK